MWLKAIRIKRKDGNLLYINMSLSPAILLKKDCVVFYSSFGSKIALYDKDYTEETMHALRSIVTDIDQSVTLELSEEE